MQNEVLAKTPGDARVFVIWFNMYPGDSEVRWPRDLFTDERVTQRWDEPKTAGRWFMTHLRSIHPSRGGDEKFPQKVDALWDTYLLFDRTATWKQAPDGLLSWGYTILRTKDQLASDFHYATGEGK